MTKNSALDQYYTSETIAQKYYAILDARLNVRSYDIALEPSAGAGSFYALMPHDIRIGIDLEPKCDGVKAMDFFDYFFEMGKRYVVIGNPPFGKNASVAVKFFNRCAEHASAIAFIVPRTFRKKSIINRLNSKFHCTFDEIVPKDSFVLDGKPCDVPCLFQIWELRAMHRKPIAVLREHADFVFVDRTMADLAIQRVGAAAGLLRDDPAMIAAVSDQSHFFIKLSNPIAADVFRAIDFESVKHNTAGNPSVSRSELIELYIETKRLA